MVINLILPQLWEKHCHKDFRNKQREEMESWREMYERCTYEREEKLDQLKVHERIILVGIGFESVIVNYGTCQFP